MDSMSKAYHEKKNMQIDHRKIKLTFFRMNIRFTDGKQLREYKIDEQTTLFHLRETLTVCD